VEFPTVSGNILNLSGATTVVLGNFYAAVCLLEVLISIAISMSALEPSSD